MRKRKIITIGEYLDMTITEMEQFLHEDEMFLNENEQCRNESNIDLCGMGMDEIIQKYNLTPMSEAFKKVESKYRL